MIISRKKNPKYPPLTSHSEHACRQTAPLPVSCCLLSSKNIYKTSSQLFQHPVSTLDCPALVLRVPSSVNCIRFAEAVRAVQQRNRRSRKSWSLSEWTYMSVCACMHACTNRGLPILPLCSNLWASRSKAAQ